MAGGPPVIVLIHGLGLKEGEQLEFDKWKEALDRGLSQVPGFSDARIRMAYYSDELHPEVHRMGGGGVDESRRHTPGSSPSPAAPLDPTSAAEEAEERLLDELLRRYWELHTEKSQEVAAEQAATGELGPRRRAVTQLPAAQLAADETYHAFVRDLVKYFGLGHREPVNAKLTAQLDAVEPDVPLLLISHSLGTIVAYDVLATGAYPIDTWLTLGSPLGYTQELQGKLRVWLDELDEPQAIALAQAGAKFEETAAWIANTLGTAKQQIDSFFRRQDPTALVRRDVYRLPAPSFPDGSVDRWFNIYDRSDPVAAPPIVGRPALTGTYLSAGRQRVYDVAITNPGNHPHSEVGYLESLQTVWLVRDFLLRTALR